MTNDELKAYLIGFDPDRVNEYTWRDARGVFDWKPGDEPAEVAIARIRSMDEWWNNLELAYEEYVLDMGAVDGPNGEEAE
jgi:hypothetical protein